MGLGFCFGAISCGPPKPTGELLPTNQARKKIDPFVEGNKRIVALENEEIELFLKRYGWNVTETGSGLRVQKTKQGKGLRPREGQSVTLKYKTYLLDGTLVYDSDSLGTKTFVLGKSEEIVGLHEVVGKMSKGDAARVIIPAHLAYGTGGDGNRVPGHKTIAMIIQLVDIK